jgi:hypothetical protein
MKVNTKITRKTGMVLFIIVMRQFSSQAHLSKVSHMVRAFVLIKKELNTVSNGMRVFTLNILNDSKIFISIITHVPFFLFSLTNVYPCSSDDKFHILLGAII